MKKKQAAQKSFLLLCSVHLIHSFVGHGGVKFSYRNPQNTIIVLPSSIYRIDKNKNHLYILPKEKLFTNKVYDTIQCGKIAVIPDFVSRDKVKVIQQDAKYLFENGYFTTDALSSYGTNGKFDPSKDRTVIKLQQWKDPAAGNYNLRTNQVASLLSTVRADLAYNLNRPALLSGASVNKYGEGSTEISYTRFGPGAYLARHVDEHHEELKGIAGWIQPTRRSISWLIYLNDNDWNPDSNGGFLRCYERRAPCANPVGARPNGDLQIGWLRPSFLDPIERPVFLDAQVSSSSSSSSDATCAMYIDASVSSTTMSLLPKQYITKPFNAHPALFVAGSEMLIQKLYVMNQEYATRFHLIEPPKSKLNDIMNKLYGPSRFDDESILDVPPLGGTLVVFDSVSLPHEVMPSYGKERWAASGWFHEDQQLITTHPKYNNNN
jgi:Rps23 Pro-64 3,4-dihydroxylase Tpa1-like proline 4-hydroxylase